MLVKQTLPFHTLNISYSPNYLLNNQLESDFHGQLIIQGKKRIMPMSTCGHATAEGVEFVQSDYH